MHPVDEFASIRAQLRILRAQETALRDGFLVSGARLRSNAYEVVIRHQQRRVFKTDLLPATFLNDPRYWRETTSSVVTVKSVQGTREPCDSEGIVLLEPFSPPPPRFAAAHSGAACG